MQALQKLIFAAVVLGALIYVAVASEVRGSIYYTPSSQTYRVQLGVLDTDRAVAYATFDDRVESTGWMFLRLTTSSTYSDAVQSYAAGYLEGYLSATRIAQHYLNGLEFTFGANTTSVPQNVRDWFSQQDAFMVAQSQKGSTQDAYWQLVWSIRQQWHGLVDGYNAAHGSILKLASEDLLIVASFGDLFDILPAIDPSMRPQFDRMAADEFTHYVNTHGHCSAIVSVAPDLSELTAGHTSWFTYSATLRIFKTLELNLRNPLVKSRIMQFSSYPATLSSNDDFLQMPDTQIVVLETTNGIYNTSLYDLVTPNALLAWHRVQIASRTATSGPEWQAAFERHNSGTYNNQYIVVDVAKFVAGAPLPDELVWIVEQIPGLVEGADATTLLRTGHFPSYNVPFIPSIYEASGYPQMVAKYGYGITWDLAPRALLFRRDAHAVVDADSIGSFLMYNRFQTDPLEKKDPWAAIASRGDLVADASRRGPDGAYDTKITTSQWVAEGRVRVRSGPTTQDQAPFDWEQLEQQTGKTYPRRGLPVRYDFPWMDVSEMGDLIRVYDA
jgi:hypothetical protein